MPARIGKQALVVGAGIAGLTAARSLADFFELVIVLENDTLPKEATHRPGTPQCRHIHGLLPGGLQALSRLFPGFEESLSQAGAVHLRMGYDTWRELPGYDPFPLRDFGLSVYSMTRPLLEYTVRKRVAQYGNIEVRENRRVMEFIASGGEAAAIGVRFENAGGQIETLPADLVIDASGHGSVTLALLNSLGLPHPEETSIAVDFGYATALFDIPRDRPTEWMGVFTFPGYSHNKRGGAIFPVEGNRWIVALAGRYEDKPPADWDGYLAFAEHLRTATVYNAIRGARRPTEIVRFGFKVSRWRHFEHLDHFPLGVLPLGDAICRFNPIYGQGMSVAVLEAEILGRLLTEQSAEGNRLTNLAARFFAEATSLIDTPWWAAAIPDFIDPRTEGERPPDIANTFKFSAALLKLAAQDAAVHKLFVEVQSLLKLRSAYRDPELVRRVKAVMAEAQTASN